MAIFSKPFHFLEVNVFATIYAPTLFSNIRNLQDFSRKCSAWKDFGLLFWSLLLQRKSTVCGLSWGRMDVLEVESLALDKGTYKSLDS